MDYNRIQIDSIGIGINDITNLNLTLDNIYKTNTNPDNYYNNTNTNNNKKCCINNRKSNSLIIIILIVLDGNNI